MKKKENPIQITHILEKNQVKYWRKTKSFLKINTNIKKIFEAKY